MAKNTHNIKWKHEMAKNADNIIWKHKMAENADYIKTQNFTLPIEMVWLNFDFKSNLLIMSSDVLTTEQF